MGLLEEGRGSRVFIIIKNSAKKAKNVFKFSVLSEGVAVVPGSRTGEE